MEIKWIHKPDCRSCAFEFNNSGKKKIDQLIKERDVTCKNCERLEEYRRDNNGHEQMGRSRRKV